MAPRKLAGDRVAKPIDGNARRTKHKVDDRSATKEDTIMRGIDGYAARGPSERVTAAMAEIINFGA